jgi:hypothetical protein
MDNNPNMIDSLFVPRRCILHTTQIGEHVREYRKEFLHKGSWHKFKSYSFSQIHKLRTKYKNSQNLYKFEENYNIPHTTTIEEIEEELKIRKLI